MGDAQLVHKATKETIAWRLIHHVDTLSKSQMSFTPSYKWNPLEIGFIKCNTDETLFKESGLIGMSCVIQNHMGAFVAAKAESTRGSVDALSVEALCCRAVLGWLKQWGMQRVEIESDCQVLVDAINDPCGYISTVGLIISYCKELMTNILECSIVFVKRSANRAAHLLARITGFMSEIGE